MVVAHIVVMLLIVLRLKEILPLPYLLELCSRLTKVISSTGSSVHGILQARILEWVAIPSSRDLPNPRMKPMSPSLQADSLLSELSGIPNNTFLYQFILCLVFDFKVLKAKDYILILSLSIFYRG